MLDHAATGVWMSPKSAYQDVPYLVKFEYDGPLHASFRMSQISEPGVYVTVGYLDGEDWYCMEGDVPGPVVLIADIY